MCLGSFDAAAYAPTALHRPSGYSPPPARTFELTTCPFDCILTGFQHFLVGAFVDRIARVLAGKSLADLAEGFPAGLLGHRNLVAPVGPVVCFSSSRSWA